jgi:hypothetical protein
MLARDALVRVFPATQPTTLPERRQAALTRLDQLAEINQEEVCD